jgi:hypothetical protein
MALTKKQRDKIPAKHFAVPETEQLPIEDEVHVKMAWKMVDKTKGLSPEQRSSARKRIINRAHELGMDTSGWNKSEDMKGEIDEQQDFNKNVADGFDADAEDDEMEKEQEEHEQREEERLNGNAESFVFSALAMEIPDQPSNHPNQTPFKGVLTRIDEPSDNPLSGSHGKCVILPKSVAEKALSSLLGMAIDSTPNLDGHDVRSKIGLITAATIVGNEIQIQGFFYGADFPSEVKRIQAEKSQLGFSYEAQAHIRSMNDDPLVIKDCVFTGAAVLYKDKAAYTTTSLSANKLLENEPMTPEEKKVFEDMQTQIASLAQKLAAAEDNMKLSGGNIMHLVKPHAEALRNCAASMAAAGMGMHPKMGHVAHLHNMADSMEAEAAMGKMPHVYQTDAWLGASAEKEKPAEYNSEMKKLVEEISCLTTKISDLEKAKFHAAAEPERKTISPEIKHLIAKAGIDVTGEKKFTPAEVDSMLKDTGMSVAQRMQAKLGLSQAGKMAN